MNRVYAYSNRILLRALELEDMELMYGIENSPEQWMVSNTTAPYSRYFLRHYITHTQSDIHAERQLRLAIVERVSGMAIGMIDLFSFDPLHNRAEIGIAVHPGYRRKGYAGDAVQQLVDYSFLFLHMHQLYVYIPADNTASLRLFKKSGFKRTGRLKDWVRRADGYVDAVVMQLFAEDNQRGGDSREDSPTAPAL